MRHTKIYFVTYRTGGTLNGRWHRVLDIFTLIEAQAKCGELERMGYRAAIQEAR